MKRYPQQSDEQFEMPVSSTLDQINYRWRALVLTGGLAAILLFVLFARLLPVYSDDGPGEPKATPDSAGIIWKYPGGDKSLMHASPSVAGDLLTNGDMDQGGFYWRYPNHYIADGWFEFFSTKRWIPEYTFGDKAEFIHTDPGSQRIHAWANSYAAGLMQSASVTPCKYYQFQAYGHSRPGSSNPPPVPVASHMKIGIEPYGWMSGRTIPKYDPGLEPEEFPATTVWSPEATNNFYFAPYQVSTEALADTVTVILYSNPEVNLEGGVLWNDSIWDTASLVEVPWQRPTLLDGDHLPAPDGVITNLTASALPNQATIEWDTTMDAYTQVLYQVSDPSAAVSPTVPMSNTLYLPRVFSIIDPKTLQYSSVDTTPVRHHQVVLTDLPETYMIEYVALSRSFQGTSCVTSASVFTYAESVSGVGGNGASTRSGGE